MDSLAVLATWLIAMVCVLALGSPIARFARLRGPEYVRAALWSGLALLAALVVLVNLWLPLRSTVAAGVLAAACLLAGAIGLRTRFLDQHGVSRWRRPGMTLVVLIALIVLALALGSALAPTHYDSGLYHLAAIRWAADHPAVPGLANLNAPLGYSTPQFPLAAALSLGPLAERGYAALNGLFLVALLLDVLLRRLAPRSRAGFPVSIVVLALVMAIALVFADLLVASPTSDTAVLVLIAAAIAAYADVLSSRRVRAADVVVLTAPAALAVSMRLQTVVFAAVVGAVVILLARRRGVGSGTGRALAAVSAITVLLAIVVVCRDIILSGRIGFPLSLWAFDVPWAAADAASLRDATIAIARDPGPGYMQTLGTWAWLPAWTARLARAWETWLLLALIGSAAVLAAAAARSGRPLRWRSMVLLVLPGVLYAITWVLVLPPTWRLAWGPILGSSAALCGWLWWRRRGGSDRLLLSALALLGVIAVGCVALRYPSKPTGIPEVAVRSVTLPSGLTILQPEVGDQCWLADPLCTPAPAPGLALRGTSLDDGFVRGAS